MAITIQGVRITTLSVTRTEEGADKISADYQLMSSAGKVLARQSLTSERQYGTDPVFTPSLETLKALKTAVAMYQKDAEEMLGLI